MSESTVELLNKLTQKYNNNKKDFYPYIEHIRFPKYKSLIPKSRIRHRFYKLFMELLMVKI